MKAERNNPFWVELRESIWMAITALSTHKLRSALTLLGILIGVFSIIVVMTAMRVLKYSIESSISRLGSQTFSIEKAPDTEFGDPNEWQKYWRRKDITYEESQKLAAKATLAASVGIEGQFWRGQISTRFAKTAPGAQLFGETPGSFAARNWDIDEGRALTDNDVNDV